MRLANRGTTVGPASSTVGSASSTVMNGITATAKVAGYPREAAPPRAFRVSGKTPSRQLAHKGSSPPGPDAVPERRQPHGTVGASPRAHDIISNEIGTHCYSLILLLPNI